MRMSTGGLLDVEHLHVRFPVRSHGRRRSWVHAVEDVTFSIAPGRTLGLVGESGSGKTTTGRAVLRLVDSTSGLVRFRGQEITHVRGEPLRQLRQHLQLVFQDPYASLNPRMTVLDIVAEPLVVHGRANGRDEMRARVVELLELVGLPSDTADRHPHAFSGGQRQRIGIARALALSPQLVVADEPVSALDVSIRAQVVNLMADLQRDLGVAYLFIAHDLSVVRHISHDVAIMYAGSLVEIGPTAAIFDDPLHPYTRSLLAAVPVPDPLARASYRAVVAGEPADPIDPEPGCRFAPRCPEAVAQCRSETPVLLEHGPGRRVACWRR